MKTFKQLRQEARAALKGNWGEAVLATLVLVIVVSVFEVPSFMGTTAAKIGSMGASLIAIFVYSPLGVGFNNAFRKLLLEGNNKIIENSFRIGFKENYWRSVGGMLLMYVFIFLWMLLLIVPGIIMSFAYALTPYILVDNPELSITDAIKRSKKLMKGHKWDLFCLELSFIGWILLSILTLGVGLLWLEPYLITTIAGFYEDIKASAEPVSD